MRERERENGPECRESKERAARPSRIGRRRRWCNWEQESPNYNSVSLREEAETETKTEEEEKKKNWDRSGGLGRGSRCRRRRLQPFPLPPHRPSGSCTETGSTLTRSSPPWLGRWLGCDQFQPPHIQEIFDTEFRSFGFFFLGREIWMLNLDLDLKN